MKLNIHYKNEIMKITKTTLFALAMTSLTACGQTQKAPQKVQSAFTLKFPGAKNIKWDKENETEWEAEFKLERKEYSANFTSEGVWKETEYEIKESEIPAAIKQILDTEFNGYEIEESEISETSKGKVYEFELEQGEINIEVAITLEGKIIKKKTLKEKTDNEED